jgi:hypothetical protein
MFVNIRRFRLNFHWKRMRPPCSLIQHVRSKISISWLFPGGEFKRVCLQNFVKIPRLKMPQSLECLVDMRLPNQRKLVSL